ncbi:putative ferredoxin [Catenulispora acidiphila DSM 44928]|uniref:Putative ferredoxin n=1 Tax=Catenulispora acidiphila (strain DSM 44928 / JCM 14897 / NBRC 102108 / NRRL B-24433 / ID139908) TaxID=479433 RepID=C7Q9V0_CATAD|nr:ferredoxin [Catenulispora acidiphila]ACU76269.1 putative ferredoxin [Catenulispora acidiphila DSM 44928]
MKLLVDATLCEGYGVCQEQAPAQIDLDDFGYAAVTEAEVPADGEPAARAAVAACPNRALRLESRP